MRHAQCRAYNTIELSLAEVSEEATTKLHETPTNENSDAFPGILHYLSLLDPFGGPRNAADIWVCIFLGSATSSKADPRNRPSKQTLEFNRAR